MQVIFKFSNAKLRTNFELMLTSGAVAYSAKKIERLSLGAGGK
jgi:hypothetical protein